MDWTGMASFVAAIGVVLQIWLTYKRDVRLKGKVEAVHGEVETVTTKVEAVHGEVKTGNGQTLGALADIAEGRAAEAIPIEDRSAAEQEHVEMKRASENSGEP